MFLPLFAWDVLIEFIAVPGILAASVLFAYLLCRLSKNPERESHDSESARGSRGPAMYRGLARARRGGLPPREVRGRARGREWGVPGLGVFSQADRILDRRP